MTERVLLVGVLALAGCTEGGPSAEQPESVRVQRVVNSDGERVVSYQAFFDDGLVTYHDYEPFGSVDLVSWEREAGLRLIVREGFDAARLPADGPELEPMTGEVESAFGVIRGGVDETLVPWVSAGHEALLGAPGR